MITFRRLALASAVMTYVLVVIGAIVRSTGSGMGCPDWPTCHGAWIPPLSDGAAWIEWVHRSVAVVLGLLVLALAVMAVARYRRQLSIVVPSILALLLVGFQAYLGKVTVDTSNAGEWVTAHLATALALLGLLTFIAVRASYSQTLPARGRSQRLTLLLAFTAASVYALMLFGSNVTATGAAFAFPDWPLFNGQLLPTFSADPNIAALEMAHFLHRIVAAIVGLLLLGTAIVVWRNVRAARRGGAAVPGGEAILALFGTATALFAVQVIVGALQITTNLAAWAVALHIALGAAIWALVAGGTFVGYFAARTADASAGEPADHGAGAPDRPDRRPVGPPARRAVVTSAGSPIDHSRKGVRSTWRSPNRGSSSCCSSPRCRPWFSPRAGCRPLTSFYGR